MKRLHAGLAVLAMVASLTQTAQAQTSDTERSVDNACSNDAYDQAIDLGLVGAPPRVRTIGDTSCATGEAGETALGEVHSLWYSFTAGSAGTATISTCSTSTDYDSWLGVYTDGATLADAQLRASNDDADNDLFTPTDNCAISRDQAQLTFPVGAGKTYRIQVDGDDAETGNFELHAAEYTCGGHPADLVGSDGPDYLELHPLTNHDVYVGLGGDDTIRGLVSFIVPMWLCGNGGDDVIVSSGGETYIEGGPGADTLNGSSYADEIFGNGGDDEIRGYGGNDRLDGGNGNDEIRGGAGRDVITGRSGDDVVIAGQGPDDVSGGEGADSLNGGAGVDTVDGGPGDDVVRGQGGGDSLLAGDGTDILRGHGGDDELDGGAGPDLLLGAAGDDSLAGRAGDDLLWGGVGVDDLDGGPDNDFCDGGLDADTDSAIDCETVDRLP